MGKKKRNLLYSKTRKVNSSNITLHHINKIFLELYDNAEAFEDKDSIELARKTRALSDMLLKASNLFNKKIKHEFNNLEYTLRANRERQAEMTDNQLRALYKNKAEKIIADQGNVVTKDLVDIQIEHMISAYRDSVGDRLGYNQEMKEEIQKKIDNFKPENLDIDDDTLF